MSTLRSRKTTSKVDTISLAGLADRVAGLTTVIPRRLEFIGRRFSVLQQMCKLNQQAVKFQSAELPKGSQPNEVLKIEVRFDAICGDSFNEMLLLAQEAVDLPARSNMDQRVKAQILLEWCVTNDGDIAHDLAASLCRDLLASKTAANRKTRG